MLCECKCQFDGRKCNSSQNWNNNKYHQGSKNTRKHQVWEKIIFGILIHVLAKIVNIKEVLLVIQ